MPRILSAEEVADFRSRLCRAAAKRFVAEGPAGVSMRRLAEDLGCSPTTPYRYFRDKDEILATVRAEAFDQFAAALERAYESRQDPVERAGAVGEAYIRFARTHSQSYRLMFDLIQPDEGKYPELARAAARARRTMSRHVEGLIEAGLLEGDPILLAHVFWSAIHGLVVLDLAGKLCGGPSFDAIYGETMRLLTRGAQPPARHDRRAPTRRKQT